MNAETIHWLPSGYEILRLAPTETPDAERGHLLAVLHEPGSTTVVAETGRTTAAPAIERSGPWRALRLEGPLPHDAVGVMARLSTALAARSVPIFALSTFDTDYVLVPAVRAQDADDALRHAGYTLKNTP